jgi:hypothetical protein
LATIDLLETNAAQKITCNQALRTGSKNIVFRAIFIVALFYIFFIRLNINLRTNKQPIIQ